MTARRIQRKRTYGWRMPPNGVYVGRPTYWGNPFVVGGVTPEQWPQQFGGVRVRDRGDAAALYQTYLGWRRQQPTGWFAPAGPRIPWEHQIRAALAGRDLCCWCPLDQPCHADTLLQIANSPP